MTVGNKIQPSLEVKIISWRSFGENGKTVPPFLLVYKLDENGVKLIFWNSGGKILDPVLYLIKQLSKMLGAKGK